MTTAVVCTCTSKSRKIIQDTLLFSSSLVYGLVLEFDKTRRESKTPCFHTKTSCDTNS